MAMKNIYMTVQIEVTTKVGYERELLGRYSIETGGDFGSARDILNRLADISEKAIDNASYKIQETCKLREELQKNTLKAKDQENDVAGTVGL